MPDTLLTDEEVGISPQPQLLSDEDVGLTPQQTPTNPLFHGQQYSDYIRTETPEQMQKRVTEPMSAEEIAAIDADINRLAASQKKSAEQTQRLRTSPDPMIRWMNEPYNPDESDLSRWGRAFKTIFLNIPRTVGKGIGMVSKGAGATVGQLAGTGDTVEDVGQAVMFGKPLPVERAAEATPGWKGIAAKAGIGLAETAPRIGMLAAFPQSLLAQSIGAGGLFGLDDQGNFNLKSAVVGALMPGVGKLAGAATTRLMAAGLESGTVPITSRVVQKSVNLLGHQAALDAYMVAADSPELIAEWKEDPAKAKKHIAEIVGQNLAWGLLGLPDFRGKVPSHVERFIFENADKYSKAAERMFSGDVTDKNVADRKSDIEDIYKSTWRQTPQEFPPATITERTPNAAQSQNVEVGNVPRSAPRQNVSQDPNEIRQGQSAEANAGDRTQPEAQAPNEPVLTPPESDQLKARGISVLTPQTPRTKRQAFAFELNDGTVLFKPSSAAHFDLLGDIPESLHSKIVNSGFVENGGYARGGDFSKGIKPGETAADYYKPTSKITKDVDSLRITVSPPQIENGKAIAGTDYVQVDGIKGGKNIWSSNPADVQKAGFDIPAHEDLLKLPKGQYSVEEATAKLAAPKPETPSTTAFDPSKVETVEVPIEKIKLSQDVPNFKGEASVTTGVVPGQELAGKYERKGTAPVVLWRRKNGDLEIITGRHRLDLAHRNKETTIPSQIVDEAQGFTKAMALSFDAEANIRDGQGSIKDYAHYFKLTPDLTEREAVSRGLLSRAKGKNGWQLARFATDDLYSLWLGDKISDEQAVAIVKAAPTYEPLQRIGVRQAAKGRTADQITNDINAAKVLTATVPTDQMDMFGSNDAAIQQMERMSSISHKKQRDIQDDIRAISGASKNPERARALGVDVKNPAAVESKLRELWAQKYRWDDWSSDSQLIRQIKAEAEPKPPESTPLSRFQGIVKLAADSPEKLRPQDVDRVMSDAYKSPDDIEAFRKWLLTHRLSEETKKAVMDWKPELELAPAETVEEQKARLAKEQADAQAKADKERLAREAAAGLKGTTGDLGQGDLLEAPKDLFAPPKPEPKAKAAELPPPEKPADTRTPAQILRQAAKIKVTVPEGATMVRITDERGRIAVASIVSLNKANTFRGVDIRKIEAGIIGRNNKFVAVPGDVSVKEPRNLALPSAKLSEDQAARVAELKERNQNAVYSDRGSDLLHESGDGGTVLSRSREGEPRESSGPPDFDIARTTPELDRVLQRAKEEISTELGRGFRFETFRLVEPRLSEPGTRADMGLGATARKKIEQVFGTKILFLDIGTKPLFNGTQVRSLPGYTFINVRANRPYLVLAGHELFHAISARYPKLFSDIVDKLTPFVRDSDIHRARLNELRVQDKQIPLNEDQALIELLSDFVGDSFADPKFWDKLAAKEPSLFRKLASAVLKFLNDTIQKLGGYGFISDIDAAHDIVANALTRFAKERGEEPPPEAGVMFSKAAPEERRAGQIAGAKDIGFEKEVESIRRIGDSVREQFFDSRGAPTPEKTESAWDFALRLTDPAQKGTEAGAVRDQAGGEMAPGLLRNELWYYAVKAATQGDTKLLRFMYDRNEDFQTIGEGHGGDPEAARVLRAALERSEFGGGLFKNLAEYAKSRAKAAGKTLKSRALYDEVEKAIKQLTVKPEDLDEFLKTGKDKDGKTIQDYLDLPPVEDPARDREITQRERKANAASAERYARMVMNRMERRNVEWLKPDAPRNLVAEIIKDALETETVNAAGEVKAKNPLPIGQPEKFYLPLRDRFVEAGVKPDTALRLAREVFNEAEARLSNKQTRKIERAAGSRKLSALIEDILNTPYRAQQDPAWRQRTAEDWFMSSGLSREQATAAAKLFSAQFDQALQSAGEKAARRLMEGKVEAHTITEVIRSIRLGLTDPSKNWSDPLAAREGFRPLTPEQHTKLADLEMKASAPEIAPGEKAAFIEEMIGVFRHVGSNDPEFLRLISESFSLSLLSGVRTVTVQAEPVIMAIRDVPLVMLQDPANAVNMAQYMINSYRKVLGPAFKFAWQKDAYGFHLQEADRHHNLLKRLWENAEKEYRTGTLPQKAAARVKQLYGMQQFVSRLLNSIDQAMMSSTRDWKLAYYSSSAFREMGLSTKQIGTLMEVAERARQSAIQDALDAGLDLATAKERANWRMGDVWRDFVSNATGDERLAMRVLRAAENDIYSTVGRRAEFIQEKDEGFVSNLFMNQLMEWISSIHARGGGSSIVSRALFGFVNIPYRTTRYWSQFSPYGLLRYGIHQYRVSHEMETFWKQSFGTELQARARLWEAVGGTVALGLATAWGAMNSTADDGAGKEAFGLYITGQGPTGKVLRDAWIKQGWQQYALNFVLNGRKVSIPLTRAGEAILYPFIIAAAEDDAKWKRKEIAATGKTPPGPTSSTLASLVGEFFSMSGQRGVFQGISQAAETMRGGGGIDAVMKQAAKQAGTVASGIVVPFKQALASISDMFVGPLDSSSISSLIANQFPILGLPFQHKAVNRFGDEMYDRSWYGKIYRTGIPIAFQISNTRENKELYETLVNKGAAPPELRRFNLEAKYGPMSNEQFQRFAQISGKDLKEATVGSLAGLKTSDPVEVKKFLTKAATSANGEAAAELGMESQKPARGGGSLAAGGPPGPARTRSTGGISTATVRAPSARASGSGVAVGSAPRAPSLGRTGGRRLSLGRMPKTRLVHGRIRLTRGSSLRGRDRLGVRKPRQRRRMSLA